MRKNYGCYPWGRQDDEAKPYGNSPMDRYDTGSG